MNLKKSLSCALGLVAVVGGLLPAAASGQASDGLGADVGHEPGCGAPHASAHVEAWSGGGELGSGELGSVAGAVPDSSVPQAAVDQAAADAATLVNGVVEDPGAPDESLACDNAAVAPPLNGGVASTPPYPHHAGRCGLAVSQPELVDGNSRLRGIMGADCWFSQPQKAVVTLRACLQKRHPLTGAYATITGGCTSPRTFRYPDNDMPALSTPRVACAGGRATRTYRTYGVLSWTAANGASGSKRGYSSAAALPCVI